MIMGSFGLMGIIFVPTGQTILILFHCPQAKFIISERVEAIYSWLVMKEVFATTMITQAVLKNSFAKIFSKLRQAPGPLPTTMKSGLPPRISSYTSWILNRVH